MKRINYIKSVSFFIISLFVLSCTSTKINELDYKIVSDSDSTEYYDMAIKYPEFKNAEYAKLNKEIANYINYHWDSFLVTYIPYDLNLTFGKYDFTVDSKVTKGKNTVSVQIFLFLYLGGAHGICVTQTFCFRASDQKFLEIEEASGYTLEELSEICRKDIESKLKQATPNYEIDDWFLDGTAPKKENYSKFYIDGDNITVLFDEYSVAPYVYGRQGVTLKIK